MEKAFSEKAKQFGDQIVSDIKDQFVEKLKVTTWMDKSVVELAIEKVYKIVQKIGYPTKVCIDFSQTISILTVYRAQTLWTLQVFKITTPLSTSVPPHSSIILYQ